MSHILSILPFLAFTVGAILALFVGLVGKWIWLVIFAAALASRDNVNAPHPDVKRRVPPGAAIGVMNSLAHGRRRAPFPDQPGADRNGLRRAVTPESCRAGGSFYFGDREARCPCPRPTAGRHRPW